VNFTSRESQCFPRRSRGVPRESRLLAGYYVFNANISFTFQAINDLYAHLTYLCFGPFCNFFLVKYSFSQRISEMYGKRKF